MPNPSNPPSNIKVFPIPGVGIEVRAKFTASNGLPATYARFQIATVNNFSTVLWDSGQVSISPIADGMEGAMIFYWIPSTTGTYYYRLCFWDNANYTRTDWTIWNGTTISAASANEIVRPVSDYSIAIAYIYPTTPTTHYDKVYEAIADDDSTFVYNNTGAAGTILNQADIYFVNIPALINNPNLKSIDNIIVTVRSRGYRGSTSDTISISVSVFSGTSIVGEKTFATLGYTFSTYTTTAFTMNPTTNSAWTVADMQALKLSLRHYLSNNSNTTDSLWTTQIYATITYSYYTFTYTPTNDNVLVQFPIFVSQEVVDG